LRDIQTGKALPHYKNMFTEEVKKFGAELNLRGEKRLILKVTTFRNLFEKNFSCILL
jgi:hypothetical protein